MTHCKTTARKLVMVQSPQHPELNWLLERPSDSHNDEKIAGYFLKKLRSMLNALYCHDEPLYFDKKTSLRNRGYMWEVYVVLYEKTTCTGERLVCHVHHATTPRATFEVSINDVAHYVLMVLRHEKAATLWHMQLHHFPSKESDSLEVHVHSNVRNDPTGHLEEQMRLTMAMGRALAEAMQEIEDLHKRYHE
jgi:hypothetical protein